jgi:TRAP-type mannitol/chloroaromatic compound transport system substrate-binding protein
MKKAGVKLNELKGEELKRAEKAAMELWEKEAKRSPASAKMVEMTKEYMRAMGYLE